MASLSLSRYDKITTSTFGCSVSGEEPFIAEGLFGLRTVTVWKKNGDVVSSQEAIDATRDALQIRTHRTFRYLDRNVSLETGREYSLCQITQRTEFYIGEPSALAPLRCFIQEII